MRKIKIVLVLLLAALAVLALTRCGKSGETEQPAHFNAGGTQQSGTSEKKKEQKLGTVTALEGGGVQIEAAEKGETKTYSFADLAADGWYMEAVNFAVTNGLMSGVDDGNGALLFKPDYGMTRAQLASILYSYAGGEPAAVKRSFSDAAESDWYYESVNWAVAQGYILPADSERFGADDFCACEEVLTILHRVAGSPSSAASLEEYPYAPKVSEEGLTATRWAWEKGLIAEDECVWYPTQAVSRAQIALLLMRFDAVS